MSIYVHKTKKRSIVLLITGILFLMIMSVIGFLIYKTEYRKSEICSAENGPYRLVIYQIGEPGFPFGSGDCCLELYDQKSLISKMDITLTNDGKWPDENNFDILWHEDRVEIIVHGEEQDDKTYVLYHEG